MKWCTFATSLVYAVLISTNPTQGSGPKSNDGSDTRFNREMVQPGLGAGFGQPIFGQQGFFQPGFVPPGFGQQGFVSPGFPQQGFGQQGFGQSGFGQQGFGQPGFGQQGFVQPGLNHQGFVQPGFNHQGFVQPGFGQQGFVQQGFGQQGRDPTGLGQGFGQQGRDPTGLGQGFGQQGRDPTGLGQGFAQPPDQSIGVQTRAGMTPSGATRAKPGNQPTQSATSSSCHFWCRGEEPGQFYCCGEKLKRTKPHSQYSSVQQRVPSGITTARPKNPIESATSASCRHWCKGAQPEQFYCCEEDTEYVTTPIVKPGGCPPRIPRCQANPDPPTTCSDDSKCAGDDKCCLDSCVQVHVCKAPIL